MPNFFSKPSHILVEHERTLLNYQKNNTKFNPTDIQHNNLISDCAQSVRDRLEIVQAIDKKIIIGFTVGTGAFVASAFFSVFGIAAIAGFAYGAYQVAQRQHAYAKYTHALENLAKACVWSLGDLGSDQTRKNDIKSSHAVQEMIATLAPLTSSEQLLEFIDKSAGALYDKDADKFREEINIFDEHLDKEKADLYYKIYGYEQGGPMAFAQGINYIFKKSWQTIKNFIYKEEPESTAMTI